MEDTEIFFSKLPPDTRIGNVSLKKILQWDDKRYTVAKEILLEEGKIKLGVGKGGSVYRADIVPVIKVVVPKLSNEPPPDLSGYESDEDAMLAFVPEKGINNNRLREKLGWDEEKYEKAKEALIADQKISKCAAGAGGGVRPFTEDDEILEEEVVEEDEDAPKNPDVFVCSCLSEDEANKVIAGLRIFCPYPNITPKPTPYARTAFYVKNEIDEWNVMVKRKWDLRVNPDTLEPLQKRAEAIKDSLVAPPAKPEAEEVPEAPPEAAVTEA